MLNEKELREEILCDVMERIAGEKGEDILILDWGILNTIGEETLPSDKHEKSMANARERRSKLKEVLDGKAAPTDPSHKNVVIGAIKKRIRGEDRLIKRARRARSKAKKRGFEPVTKPGGLKDRLEGVSLGQDKNGYFVYTHRARSKSYEMPGKIPLKKIQFIRSTG